VLVIEATEQNSTAPNHDAWEDVVLAADYRFAAFDGLNRFYARAEEPELVDVLRVPPNVFDDFGPADVWNRVADLEREIRRLTADVRHLRAELDAGRTKPQGRWRRLFRPAA
jgi:hypothetical protein